VPPADRLQPTLLDRLIDDAPGTTVEPPERRVMSRAQLRAAVLRDLAWLFNTTRLESTIDMTRAVHARRSVVNFGVPAFGGRWASAVDVATLERAIRQAILDFEPRILPNTLRVRAIARADRLDHHNVLSVEIHGHLWAQPVPVALLVRTQFDLETGRVEVSDLGAASRGM